MPPPKLPPRPKPRRSTAPRPSIEKSAPSRPPPDGTMQRPLPDPGVGKRTVNMWYIDIKQPGYEDGLPRLWKPRSGRGGEWSCPCGDWKHHCEIHKGDKVTFDASEAAKFSVPEPQHTLVFVDFEAEATGILGEHIFTYRDSKLWGRGEAVRGKIAERVVRRFDELVLKHETTEPAITVDCSGNMRVEGNEIHEYRRELDGGKLQSVEVKNRRPGWDTHNGRWVVQWENIKEGLHDVLILCLETPTGYLIYERGTGTVGDGGNGVAEEVDGKHFKVYSTSGYGAPPDVRDAIEEMHTKLVARGNTFHREIAFDDKDYADLLTYRTVTDDVYEGTPLAELSHSARGDVCQELARLVGRRVLGWGVSDAEVTDRVDGVKRGCNATKADFDIYGDATEVKSSLMCWNKHNNRFYLRFERVKVGNHKRRILVMVSPRGLHLFEHTGSTAGFSGAGARTATHGETIKATAPVGMRNAVQAEKFLLKQLFHHWKLPYLAFVKF